MPNVVDAEGRDRAIAINMHQAEDDTDVLWCFDAMKKLLPGWEPSLAIADSSTCACSLLLLGISCACGSGTRRLCALAPHVHVRAYLCMCRVSRVSVRQSRDQVRHPRPGVPVPPQARPAETADVWQRGRHRCAGGVRAF